MPCSTFVFGGLAARGARQSKPVSGGRSAMAPAIAVAFALSLGAAVALPGEGWAQSGTVLKRTPDTATVEQHKPKPFFLFTLFGRLSDRVEERREERAAEKTAAEPPETQTVVTKKKSSNSNLYLKIESEEETVVAAPTKIATRKPKSKSASKKRAAPPPETKTEVASTDAPDSGLPDSGLPGAEPTEEPALPLAPAPLVVAVTPVEEPSMEPVEEPEPQIAVVEPVEEPVAEPEPQVAAVAPVEEPVAEPAPQVAVVAPVEEPVAVPAPQVAVVAPVEEPVAEPEPQVAAVEPVEEPVAEPESQVAVVAPVEEPVAEPEPQVAVVAPVEEPVAEPAPQVAAVEPVEEPVAEPQPQVAAVAPVEEPVEEPAPQVAAVAPVEVPVAEPEPQVAAVEPVEEPVAEPAPQVAAVAPVEEPVAEPAPQVAVVAPVEEPVAEPVEETAPQVAALDPEVAVPTSAPSAEPEVAPIAASPAPDITYIKIIRLTQTGRLSLREGPGTDYRRLALLPGASVGLQLLERSDEWAKIRFCGFEGWVSTDYTDTMVTAENPLHACETAGPLGLESDQAALENARSLRFVASNGVASAGLRLGESADADIVRDEYDFPIRLSADGRHLGQPATRDAYLDCLVQAEERIEDVQVCLAASLRAWEQSMELAIQGLKLLTADRTYDQELAETQAAWGEYVAGTCAVFAEPEASPILKSNQQNCRLEFVRDRALELEKLLVQRDAACRLCQRQEGDTPLTVAQD